MVRSSISEIINLRSKVRLEAPAPNPLRLSARMSTLLIHPPPPTSRLIAVSDSRKTSPHSLFTRCQRVTIHQRRGTSCSQTEHVQGRRGHLGIGGASLGTGAGLDWTGLSTITFTFTFTVSKRQPAQREQTGWLAGCWLV